MSFMQTFRVGDKELTEPMNRKKAIKMACRDCCGGSVYEVKDCHIETCPLHPFRTGSDPSRTKRILTNEQRNRIADRFATMRRIKSASHSTGDSETIDT